MIDSYYIYSMMKNNFLKTLTFSIALLSVVLINAQSYGPGNKSGGLYRTNDDVLDKGWFFGVGATYMMPYSRVTETIESTDSITGATYSDFYAAQPKNTFAKSFTTQFGPFLEVGKFRMTGKRVINYMDYGLSYKWFRGGENFTHTSKINDVVIGTNATRGTFSDHALSGNFNLGYRYDRNEKTFFVNGIGLNLDYLIITSRDGGGVIPTQEHKFTNSLIGEMHYFFGFGIKTNKRLIIMPMIETPILALYPFNHIVSTHDYFNTRHRPVFIKIRFMFLKKGSTSCPAVYNPMGIDPKTFTPDQTK